MQRVAFITQPGVIRKILAAVAKSTCLPAEPEQLSFS